LECACTDTSRYVLNGVFLDTRDKDAHYVIGTDGRHLYSSNSFRFDLPEPLIIPSHKFPCWAGFVEDGPWKLSMLPGVKAPEDEKKKAREQQEKPPWFQIQSDRWSYIAKAVNGDYPNWKQVVPVPSGDCTTVVLEPTAIKTILDSVPLLPGADDQNVPIVLEILDNRLLLKARAKDQKDETRVPIGEAQITGKPVEVSLNRSYLLKALRFGLNQVQIIGPIEPLLFTNGNRQMIVMPLRGEAVGAPQGPHQQPPPPPENAAAAPVPSPAKAPKPTETKRTHMPENTRPAAQPAKPSGNGSKKHEESDGSLDGVMNQIDAIKTSLREILNNLAETQTLIKAAAREKKASQKEIESVRTTLRSLQKVEI
jgi:DNA-binding FrmR family transcriptional regulator